MSKETYLRFLRAYLTGRLPAGEVEEILRYYTEYFEDAGEGREQAVMAELGSPERLAQHILGQRGQENMVPAAEPDYSYGQGTGYAEPNYVPVNRGGMPRWIFILLLVMAAIFAGPPLAMVVFGLGLAGVLCIFIGLRVAIGGIRGMSIAGLLFQSGGGLIAAAVGILLLLGAFLTGWLALRLIRWFRDTYVERSAEYEEGY